MSAASAAAPSLVRSSSRRQQSYSAPTNDRPHRTPSIATKLPTTPNTVARTAPQPHTSDRPSSSSQQAQLANVARRDYETTNVARPASSRRSSSRDGAYAAPTPKRTESTRDTRRQSANPGHARNSSYTSPAVPVANGASSGTPARALPADSAAQGSGSTAKRRTTIPAQTGQWSLGKTIGAGSMGKVKLAKNLESGEQVAVKIVPRQSTDDHHSNRERERADQSKEIRTAREAAIVTLLSHPYICAMRDVVRTNYHWYMLFEYVNGGQMLDYIISHGRLKEKQARKFGRQIASALDYCHRNSIVHRDLKIENILISKTGDIKIIDFGLSNLFSPRAQLKTFCGSLYFAAPELLQARQYTGPEVDIWSFGIVLYVLVCGKVPFDDQSMPQLHAKIKEGVVDYPSWLSTECRNLISRMLVTDPKKRASLGEILSHPWITKGFNSPPENYLPHREPIQLPLDSTVIEKMTGFDFGSSEYITRELTKIINSDEYQEAVRLNTREQQSQAASGEKKRGVFDFYKRRSSISSRDTLPNTSAEAVQLGQDPVNAFSPFLSIYYLVREKQERERLETNPGALSMPRSPGEKPLKMPDLPPPEAAYTNSTAYEMPGEKATGGRSRPRSRTHGEDEVTEGMKRVNMNATRHAPPPTSLVPPTEQPAKKESTAVGILRRFSTRRSKEPSRDRSSTAQTPSLQVQPPAEQGSPMRKSFSVRRSRNREPTPQIHPGGSTPHQPELLTPTGTREGRPVSTLDRSASVNSVDHRKRQSRRVVSERHATLATLEPPVTSGSDRSDTSEHKSKASEPAPTEHTPSFHPRSATARTKSLGHGRRESMQARRSRREDTQESREADVPEETDQELAEDERKAKNGSTENMKPVFLKGLFSVSTTSSKPLSYIRMDIVRVLRQLGVEYTEIKGGFSCRHAPSIDIHANPPSPEQGMTPKTNRRISFGGFRGGDSSRDDEDKSPQMVRKSAAQRQRPTQDTSFTGSEGSDEDSVRRPVGNQEANTAEAGQTTTHVQSDFGSNMVLRFEVFIVKVPLFSLHGIQFKKVAGGTWPYKNMASKILDALRL
ncbi:MAG: hypothetical protein Q9184_004627 [Pyrenodesmia sp. 2 TL-2023]